MSGKIPMGADGEDAAISVVRVLLWGVASAIGILVVLLALLHLPPVQGVVADFLIQKIEDRTGLEITVAGYGWQPLSQLDLNGLSIRTGESQILECDRVSVAYGFSPRRPFVHLEGVTLEKPVFHLVRTAAAYPLPTRPATGFPPGAGSWQVHRPGCSDAPPAAG